MRASLPPFAAALLALLLAACAPRQSAVVSIDGSTSMERVMSVLQETFPTPEITVNLSGTGSGAGIEAVLSGTCDIGLSSRPLKPAEEEKGAEAHLIALDGIALAVHPSNPVTDLTTEELAAIFTGRLTNWRQLGGNDAPIAVCGREAGSGSRSAFESVIGAEDRCRYTNEYGSTGDIIGSVSLNPNAVGYVSPASVNDSVSVLRVNGVRCTAETIRSGEYPFQRPFLMITRRGIPLSPAAQSFLDYARSSEAAAAITFAGAVPP